MRIISPSFEVLNPANRDDGIAALRFVEKMARISHRSEEAQTENSWERFIRFVCIEKGDLSVAEHSMATVLFTLDRGVTHELVRHRLFAFTQESTRFVNYKKVGEIDVIRPEGIDHTNDSVWMEGVSKACWAYTVMMERGGPPQMARSVLPNALASRIAVTGNYRNWRYFLIARTTKETHPDFRRVTIPLLAEFQARVPILFEDIEPNSKQSIAFSKAR